MTTNRWLVACLFILLILAACTPTIEPVSVTRPVTLTTTAVPPTASATATAPVTSLSPSPTAPATPTVTPTPQPTLTADGRLITDEPIFVGSYVRVDGWSPDSRYLAYFEHTHAQVDDSLGIPGTFAGTFVIYDTANEEKCLDYVLDATYPLEGARRPARYLWLPDNGHLLILTEDDRLWQASVPCEEDMELTAVFPESIQYIHGFTPDKSLLLFAGETRYWIYDWHTQTATQIPEVVPDIFNNLVWSPNGTYLAITLAGNYTGNRDPIGGSRVIDMATGQIIARHDWEPDNALDSTFGGPVWLDEETFVVTLALDQGPFFMTVDGRVEPVLPLFGDIPQENIKRLDVYVEPDNGNYHLLLTDWSGGALRLQPRIFHSNSGEVELLAIGEQGNSPGLTADGQIKLLKGSNEMWSRPVTAVGEPLTPMATPEPTCSEGRAEESLVFRNGDFYRVTNGECHFLTAVFLPESTIFRTGNFSPDEKLLALVSGGTLYIVSLNFLE